MPEAEWLLARVLGRTYASTRVLGAGAWAAGGGAPQPAEEHGWQSVCSSSEQKNAPVPFCETVARRLREVLANSA